MDRLTGEILSVRDRFRSLPFWSWNDKLERDELRRQIRDMKSLGMGGFFMHARGGLITEYMSDDWFGCVEACIDEARNDGMEAWAYDENGWPSGFGGGILLKDPKNHATAIEYRFGPYEEPDGTVIMSYVKNPDGSFSVASPGTEGECLVLYRRRDESYVDTINPDIARQFIDAIYAEYLKRIPKSDIGEGKPMPGFFTDEPQYYRWGNPYSDTLPEVFEKTYGYPIYGGLPAIFFDYEGADAFRFDYYYLIHKLFIDGFIKQIYEWCRDHGVCLTGHAVEETTLNGQMMCAGSVMPFYEYETIPGIDYLGRQILDDLSFKQLGSACAQLGKERRISEMFACCGWAVTPRQLKRVAEVQYASGVNMMCQHLYPYSERGQRKTDYPLHYSEHNPWHGYMREFNDYFTNLGAVLSRGEEYAPVLVIHPVHGAFCRYRKGTDSLDEIEERMFSLSRLLGENQVPYHYGDEWMMERLAKVGDGKIRVGRCVYEAVVVPFTYSLDSNTARLLRELSESGGKIYLYGGVPKYVDGRPEKGRLSFLRSTVTFDDILAMRDAVISENGRNVPDIRKMTRITDDGRIVFVTNTGEDDHRSVDIALPGTDWALLDVGSLSYTGAPGRTEGDGTVISLPFAEGQSHVLVSGRNIPFSGRSMSLPEKTVGIPETLELVSCGDNILTLDMPSLSYDGITYEDPLYVMGVRDMLLKKRYDGRVWLRFAFDADSLPSRLNLVAEPMYDRITVNGRTVASSPNDAGNGWWFDRSFRTFDILPYTVKGRNEIVIEVMHRQSDYVYYVLYGGVSEALRNCLVFDCEIESVYLTGDFSVKCPGKFEKAEKGAVLYDGPFVLDRLPGTVNARSITESGFPFFGGEMTVRFPYRWSAGMPKQLKLTGRFAAAEISVNGNQAGTLLLGTAADLSSLLEEGDNTIEIKLTDSMRNTLGPHHYRDAELDLVGRQMWTFENEWDGRECPVYRKRYSFMPFGIL